MCQNCNNNSCGGCNQQCYQFPPPPGPPGQVGPQGPQGPAGPCPCPLNLVKIVGPATYAVTTIDDVILVDTRLGVVTVTLLSASNPAIFNRKLIIKDAFGTSGTFDVLVDAGLEDIDTTVGITSLFGVLSSYGSMELVSNQINGYNII